MLAHRGKIKLSQLAFAVAILFLVWQLRAIALFESGPIEKLPEFDFEIVQRRCVRVFGMSEAELYAHLGAPTGPYSLEPEMEQIDGVFAAHPDRYPSKFRHWSKWVDPNDPQRWVAVMICGDRVYHTVQSRSLVTRRTPTETDSEIYRPK